jgi:FkbM family methyltransferase
LIPDLIFDIGMHNGDDTAHYLSEGFRVVAVEANPLLAESGRNRFSDAIACGKLTICNVGISDREGVREFWINREHSEFSSLLPDVAGRNGLPATPVEIPVVTLGSVLVKYGVPFYLKVDIERYDVQCIKALQSLEKSDLPVYVSVEANELSYLEILRQLGYTGFKCIDQTAHNIRRDLGPTWFRWLRRKTMRAADLMGIYAPPFPQGSSGAFGEKSPGSWQPFEAVAFDWRNVMSGKSGRLYRKGWFDFHAARTYI